MPRVGRDQEGLDFETLLEKGREYYRSEISTKCKKCGIGFDVEVDGKGKDGRTCPECFQR